MTQEQYLLHYDGLGRYLLQDPDTGVIAGFLFRGMPGESARAFSYDYGSVWYPNQIINLSDFSELADMPFFTIESCSFYNLDDYFNKQECQAIWPMLGTFAKFSSYGRSAHQPLATKLVPLWQYTFPNPNGNWKMPIFGIEVNGQGCWLGNREGWVVVVNHDGEMIQQYKLPKLCRGLVEINDAVYAGCDDGKIYEFSGKIPQEIYDLESPNQYWLYNPILALTNVADRLLIADLYGKLECLDLDFNYIWQQHFPENWQTYFVGTDQNCLYQGSYHQLVGCDLKTGEQYWQKSTPAPILCGVILDDLIIVGCGDRQIYGYQKNADPQLPPTVVTSLFTCEGIPYTIITIPHQKSLLIADFEGNLYYLDLTEQQQTAIALPCGAVTAMRIWENMLYVGTAEGIIASFDLPTILSQSSPLLSPLQAQNSSTNAPIDQSHSTSSQVSSDILLECIKQGKKLKVRPRSPGYYPDWNVAFPQHLRVEGAFYRVEGLKEAKSRKFYRVVGQIIVL